MLRVIIECARTEPVVQQLLRQRRYVPAASAVLRCGQLLQQESLRGMSGVTTLGYFARRAADLIKNRAFDFLVGVLFLRFETEDPAALPALFHGGPRSAAYLASSARGSPLRRRAAGRRRLPRPGRARPHPAAALRRRGRGARELLQRLRGRLRRVLREDAAERGGAGPASALAGGGRGGAGGASGTGSGATASATSAAAAFAAMSGVAGAASSSSAAAAAAMAAAASHVLSEEQRGLADSQRAAVSAFFGSALRQAAVILCNVQRVVDIVLEMEAPFFPSSAAAADVWKSLASKSVDSWNVEDCVLPAALAHRVLMRAIARVYRRRRPSHRRRRRHRRGAAVSPARRRRRWR